MSFSEFNIALVLCVSRFTPLLLSGGIPPFSQIPKSVRIVLILVVSTLFSSTGKLSVIYQADERMIIFIISELLIGLVFIFGIAIVYGAIDFVGKMVDIHMGFAAVSLFNPFSGQAGSLLGNALVMLLVTLLVTLNIHVELIRMIGISFELVSLGELDFVLDPGKFITHLSGVFVLSVMIFIPVFSALFIVDLAINMVSKSMPQMNVYFVTLPLKIFCGVVFMALTVRSSAPALVNIARQTTSFLDSF